MITHKVEKIIHTTTEVKIDGETIGTYRQLGTMWFAEVGTHLYDSKPLLREEDALRWLCDIHEAHQNRKAADEHLSRLLGIPQGARPL